MKLQCLCSGDYKRVQRILRGGIKRKHDMNTIPTLTAQLADWEEKKLERHKQCSFLKARLCVEAPRSKATMKVLKKKTAEVARLAKQVG